MEIKTKTKLLKKQTARITSEVCSLSVELQRENFKQNYFKICCCTLKSFVSKPDSFVCALLNSIILAGFTEFKLNLIQTANSQPPFQIHYLSVTCTDLKTNLFLFVP